MCATRRAENGSSSSHKSGSTASDSISPTHADGDFIQSLMKPVYEPGKYASWIAPPKVGIDNKPGDFEYVKLHMA